MSLKKPEQLLFALACGFGIFLIWQIPRLPMMDLTQHVVQISLLHDLLFVHTADIASQLRIDWATPYWLFYGPAALLTYFMPALAATKLLLGLSFLAFIWAGQRCLREFDSPPHLIWAFLPAFFGLCWMMGFVTFLAAAPLVLLALLLASRYSQRPGFGNGLWLMALLLFLYMCHALAFALAGLLCGSIWLAAHYRNFRLLCLRSWPLWPPALIAVLHYLLSPRGAANIEQSSSLFALSPVERLWHTLSYQVSFFTPLTCAVILLLLLCMLASSSSKKLHPRKLVPVTVLFLLLMLSPQTLAGVDIIFDRFSLYLLPLLALALAPVQQAGKPAKFAKAGLVICSLTLLAVQAKTNHDFANQTRPFIAIENALPNGSLILGLVDEPLTQGRAGLVLWHYPLWYQIDHQGFAEPSFAYYTPQIVRYITQPPYASVFRHGRLSSFDWNSYQANRYDYIIIAHTKPPGSDWSKGASCTPQFILTSGLWSLYKVVRQCP